MLGIGDDICELVLTNCFSYIKNSSDGTNFGSILATYPDSDTFNKILLNNVKSNNSTYYVGATNDVNKSGSTVLEQDSGTGDGTGSNDLTASDMKTLFINIANVHDCKFNPSSNMSFMNQIRIRIPNTNNYFPLIKNNNLRIRNKFRINTFVDSASNYTLQPSRSLRAYFGSIIIEPKKQER